MTQTVYVTQTPCLTHKFEDDGIIAGFLVYENLKAVPKEDLPSVHEIEMMDEDKINLQGGINHAKKKRG